MNKGSKRNKRVGNYGEALYESTAEFVADADPIVKTFSIATTVHGGHITGAHAHSQAKTHRDAQWERMYQDYLNKGFQLSPSANQDTHGPNWGTVTAARTAFPLGLPHAEAPRITTAPATTSPLTPPRPKVRKDRPLVKG